jgi:hypothetical protein
LKTVSDERLKCSACGQIHLGAHLVTLHDGRQVGSYSEEWRLECEAKAVVRLPTLDRRRKYLDAVKEKRGTKAWNELQDRILSLWKTSKPSAQPQVAQNSGSTVRQTPGRGSADSPEQTGLFF